MFLFIVHNVRERYCLRFWFCFHFIQGGIVFKKGGGFFVINWNEGEERGGGGRWRVEVGRELGEQAGSR